MYTVLYFETGNGKDLEFGLMVDKNDYSFEVDSICIDGLCYESENMSSHTVQRIHRYIIKNVKNLYKLFRQYEQDLRDNSLNDFNSQDKNDY